MVQSIRHREDDDRGLPPFLWRSRISLGYPLLDSLVRSRAIEVRHIFLDHLI